MTCIAARIRKGRVHFAADSAISSDDGSISIDVQPKVRQYPQWGLVGERGQCGPLERAVHAFSQEVSLARLVRSLCQVANDDSGDTGWLFVDPKDGRLTVVDSTGGIMKRSADFEAIGCGDAWALGALAHGASPKRAVEIACQYNAFCRPPVRLYSARVK